MIRTPLENHEIAVEQIKDDIKRERLVLQELILQRNNLIIALAAKHKSVEAQKDKLQRLTELPAKLYEELSR